MDAQNRRPSPRGVDVTTLGHGTVRVPIGSTMTSPTSTYVDRAALAHLHRLLIEHAAAEPDLCDVCAHGLDVLARIVQ